MKIQARKTKVVDGKRVPQAPVAFEYDLPASLADKVKKFGEDVVNAAAEDSFVIAVQALARRLLEKGKNAVEIQTAVAAWLPNVRTIVRQTAFEKASTSIKSLSPEERKQLLAQLQAIK